MKGNNRFIAFIFILILVCSSVYVNAFSALPQSGFDATEPEESAGRDTGTGDDSEQQFFSYGTEQPSGSSDQSFGLSEQASGSSDQSFGLSEQASGSADQEYESSEQPSGMTEQTSVTDISGIVAVEASVPAEIVSGSFENISIPENDELLEGYIEQTFEEETGAEVDLSVEGDEPVGDGVWTSLWKRLPAVPVFGAMEVQAAETTSSSVGKSVRRRSYLSGKEALLYDYLETKIKETAAGNESSSSWRIPVSVLLDGKTSYTAEELGVKQILNYEGAKAVIDADAKKAFHALLEVDATTVISSLLCDLPYEFYWFDKTSGYTMENATSYTGYEDHISFDDNAEVVVDLNVSRDYSASGQSGTFNIDTSKTQAAKNTVNTAVSVVDAAKGKTDREKLAYYKDWICGQVVYFDDAANDKSYPYGNPWQLIWVFDGDPSTNVVCEGYSKAFKLLCDLTTFNSNIIDCYLLSGTMQVDEVVTDLNGTVTGSKTGNPGEHMWNVVKMDDGENYLVDVTNCDEDCVGNPDGLFLKGYNSIPQGQTVYKAYTIDCVENKTDSVITYKVTFTYNAAVSLAVFKDVERQIVSSAPLTEITADMVAISPSSMEYDGQEKKPSVTVICDNITLVNGTDYSVSYNDNVNAGTGSCIVTAAGNYKGTVTVGFSIEKAGLSIAADNISKEYGAADPQLTYSVSGLKGNDAVSTVMSGSLVREAGESAGEYRILQGTLKCGDNYTISSFDGALFTIKAAQQTTSNTTDNKTGNNTENTTGNTTGNGTENTADSTNISTGSADNTNANTSGNGTENSENVSSSKTTGSEIVNTGVASPVKDVNVSGLEEYTKSQPGENVSVKLELSPVTEAGVSNSVSSLIRDMAGLIFSTSSPASVNIDYFDINVIKKQAGQTAGSSVSDVGRAVEIALTVDDMSGKHDIVVIREHGGSVTQFIKLPSRAAAGDYTDGTCYISGNTIYLYSQFFSTYSLAYTDGNTVDGYVDPDTRWYTYIPGYSRLRSTYNSFARRFNYDDDDDDDDSDSVKEGDYDFVAGKGAKKAGFKKIGRNSVSYNMSMLDDEAKTAVVPAYVSYGRKKYIVTNVSKNAFSGYDKLVAVRIGKNIVKIESGAFKGCKKLSEVTVNSRRLTSKGVKGAFRGCGIKDVYVPADWLNKYQKIFTSKNTGSSKEITVKSKLK